MQSLSRSWVTFRIASVAAGMVAVSSSGCSTTHSRLQLDQSSKPIDMPAQVQTVDGKRLGQHRNTEEIQPNEVSLANHLVKPTAAAHSETAHISQAVAAKTDVLVLSLDQVINATLLADPRLRAGFEAINQANGDALSASLKPNPTLNIDQTLLPLGSPFTEDRQGGPPQFDVNIRQPIDWYLFGKRAAAMQAAALDVRVSEAEFAELIRQRVTEAALAYFDIVEAKALLDLARQDAENLLQVEELTKKAVEDGGRPQVELSRIRLDRLQAEQSVRDAQNDLVAAKAALFALIGRNEADLAFDVATNLDDISDFELYSAEEAYRVASENRPDLAAQRWRVLQAHAGVEVERRNAYPEVAPVVGYTRQFQRKAIGFPDANSFGFGVEMTLPFFDRNQGNRFRAASIALQQQIELQAELVDLRAEVIQADQEARTTIANAKAIAEEQLKLASEVRDSLNSAYSVGGRPLIDVLDAQRNYRETYRLYIESRANLGRAAVRYNAVLGKKVAP